MKTLPAVAVAPSLLSYGAFATAPVVFTDRGSVAAAAGPLAIDGCESDGYTQFQTDAQMNSVTGLTRYTSNGFADRNLVAINNLGVSAAAVAVPDPSNLAQLGLGLAGVGGVRRRGRHAAATQ